MRPFFEYSFFRLSFIFILTVLIFPLSFFSQERSGADIFRELKNVKQDSTRMQLLNEAGEYYASINKFDSTFIFFRKGNSLAYKHFADKSIFQHSYRRHYVAIIQNLMGLHGNNGHNDSTMKYIFVLKKFMEDAKDLKGLAHVATLMGINYFNMGDLVNSGNAYYESLKLNEKAGNKKGLANSYTNLAFISMASDNIDQALIYSKKALETGREVKDTAIILMAIGNLAASYEQKNDTAMAVKYVKERLSIALKTNDSSLIAGSWSGIAGYYFAQGKKDSALILFKKALGIFSRNEDPLYVVDVSYRIGNIYINLRDDKNAFFYLNSSLKLAEQLNRPAQIRGPARLLSFLYKKTGKYKEAYEMYDLFVRMNDSLNNAESKKATTKKQFQYEYEKKAAADSVKNAEQQKVKDAQLAAQTASLKQEKFQRYSLVVGLSLVVCGLLFVINRFRITQKQKKIIEEQKIKVDEAFEKLHVKNKEVMDSIYYARRIQRALLTPEKYIDRVLKGLRSKS